MDKQLMRLALALLLCPLAWGADCSLALGADNPKNLSATAGLWTGTGCTGGSFIPGTGDTVVTISGTGTSALTVDQAWTIGTSPSDSTTFVFQNKVPLIVNAAIRMKGNARSAVQCAAGTKGTGCGDVAWGPGSSLTFDPTGAATPASAIYVWNFNDAMGFPVVVTFQGTSNSPVTWTTDTTGCATCVFAKISSSGATYNGSFLQASSLGAAATPGINAQPADNQAMLLTDASFDNCGYFNVSTGSLSTSGSITLRRVKVTNSLSTSDLKILSLAAKAGTVVLDSVVLAKTITLGSDLSKTTITQSFLTVDPSVIVPTCPITKSVVRSASANNMWSAGTNTAIDGNVFITDTDAGNGHGVGFKQNVAGIYSNNLFEYPGRYASDAGDAILTPSSATGYTGPTTYTLTGNVFNVSGMVLGGVSIGAGGFTHFGASDASRANILIVAEHNSQFYSGTKGFVGFETSTAGSNTITARSNLVYNPAANGDMVMAMKSGACVPNPCVDAAACNYNWCFNCRETGVAACTNEGHSYEAAFTGVVPGTSAGNIGEHDGSADPKLLDVGTRMLVNFDQRYLAQPLAAAWAGSGTTALGGQVSNADTGFYSNLAINYRCIAAAGCDQTAANSEPGVGSSWRTYWEFATYKYLRDGVFAGTRYTDSAIGVTAQLLPEVLRRWVFKGWAPTSTALKTAAHDGTAPGAEPWMSVGGGQVFGLIFGW